MAGTFGGAVKLSGESDYRKALTQITNNLKELKSEMGLVSSEYDKNDKSTEALTARSEVLQKTLDKQKEKVSLVEKQLASLSKQQAENAQRHDDLQRRYEEEVRKLEEIKRVSGEGSAEYQQQAKAVAEMSNELNKSSKALTTNENELSKVKTALNNAKAETNKTSKELDSLQKEEQDTTKGTKEMKGEMDNYSKSTEKAGKSSISFGDIVKANVVSEAIIGGFKLLASAIGKVTGAMKDAVVDGAKYADEILTLSSVTSLSTDTLQEYSYMANLIDTDVNTIATSLKKLTSNMNSAKDVADGNIEKHEELARQYEEEEKKLNDIEKAYGKNSEQYTKQMGVLDGIEKKYNELKDSSNNVSEAFAQLGISVTDSEGNLRNSTQVFDEVIDKLAGITNETERDALAMQIFGKSATELNPMIEVGADRLEELRKQAHETGYVLSNDALGALGQTQDAFDTLQNSITGVKNNLASRLAPAINSISSKYLPEFTKKTNELFDAFDEGGLEGFAGKLSEIVTDMLSELPEILPTILTAITDNLPTLISTTIEVFQSVLNALIEALPELVPVILDAIKTISDTIITNLPTIISTAIEIILALVQGLTEAIPDLIPAIFDAIYTIIDTLLENLPLLIETGMKLVVALVKGIAKEIPTLVKEIPKIIKSIQTTLTENLPMLIESAGEIIFALITGIVEALPDLIAMIPDIIINFVETLVKNFPKIIEAGGKLIAKLGEGISNAFGKLGKIAGETWETIKKGIGDVWTKALDIGKKFIEGIWQGIKNAGEWLWEKISGFGNDVVNFFKDIFGIHSPSKVFADQIGTNMALGIGAGFEKAMDGVSSDMAESIPTSFDINTTTKNSQKPMSVADIANIFVGCLKDMKIELDDEVAGRFVTRRVEAEIYG